MHWIDEINNPEQYLPEDYKIIAELVGLDGLLKLIKHFGKTTVYFTEQPLKTLKEKYIRMAKTKDPELSVKILARKTGLSERQVYEIIKKTNLDNYELFNGEEDEI